MKRWSIVFALLLGIIPAVMAGQLSGRTLAAGNPGVEFLHSCGAVAPGFARCHAIVAVRPDHPHPKPTPTPTSTSGGGYPTSCTNPGGGYTPCDLVSAYNTPSTTAGSGQTVAIVDAYDDPNAEGDLGVYRSQFGLSPCTTSNSCFSKVNQSGGTSYPKADGGWAQEISLDLDMVSAVCPNCKILLVEASSNSFNDLLTAEDYATANANYVSNSWSGGEFSGETSYDAHFEYTGKVYVFASGDSGYGAQYPATSPYVVAAGGTTLTRDSSTRGWSETAWSGAGSGCSSDEAQPAWQSTVSNIINACRMRAEADVSAVADPNTGVDVYDSYSYQGISGWMVFGGTSVATPILASVYALSGNTNPASFLYSHTGSLNDVTSGNNGSCGNDLCDATAGWDGPTGNGTPNGTGAF